MDQFQSLNHTKWDFKYHIAFIPEGREKVLSRHVRRYPGEVFRRLAEQKESRIEEATPRAALSGSNPKAPGFAGGYLLMSHFF